MTAPDCMKIISDHIAIAAQKPNSEQQVLVLMAAKSDISARLQQIGYVSPAEIKLRQQVIARYGFLCGPGAETPRQDALKRVG